MWKEVQRTRKKEVLSSHFVESSRPSLTTVRLEVPETVDELIIITTRLEFIYCFRGVVMMKLMCYALMHSP